MANAEMVGIIQEFDNVPFLVFPIDIESGFFRGLKFEIR